MDKKQIEALRQLVLFAQTHAEEVYGDADEYPENEQTVEALYTDAEVVQKMVDDITEGETVVAIFKHSDSPRFGFTTLDRGVSGGGFDTPQLALAGALIALSKG